MIEVMVIKRGEIYYVKQGKDYMNGKGKTRPAIVVSNDAMNNRSDRIMVIYLTTQDKGRPENVPVNVRGIKSFAICENINTIYKDRLLDYVGMVPDDKMLEIEEKMLEGLGFENRYVGKLEDTLHQDEEELLIVRDELEELREESKFYKRAYEELLKKMTRKAI